MRVAVRAPAVRAEELRARMLEVFPEGFEEIEGPEMLETAAYTDATGVARAQAAFGEVQVDAVEPDWAERWREFHRPARVGSLWLGPPWLDPDHYAVPVVIDPGRAFGTGAHATTGLCLALLLELPRGGLLDAGCGSGVVAIAAAKVGFGPVVAFDIDPAAVEATERNAAANGVDVDVRLGDVLVDALPAAEVCVANIALGAVEALAHRRPASLLVASGYLEADEPRTPGYSRVERRMLDNWAADLLRRD